MSFEITKFSFWSSCKKKKRVEFSGSLKWIIVGIDLSIALRNKNNSQVFVVMSVGAMKVQGQLIAPNLQIDNFTVIIDKNNFQQTGSTIYFKK